LLICVPLLDIQKTDHSNLRSLSGHLEDRFNPILFADDSWGGGWVMRRFSIPHPTSTLYLHRIAAFAACSATAAFIFCLLGCRFRWGHRCTFPLSKPIRSGRSFRPSAPPPSKSGKKRFRHVVAKIFFGQALDRMGFSQISDFPDLPPPRILNLAF
jgi:hypothetical protein